jgi:hypothetical protein
LASAWPRSLTEPRIDRQAELREHPRRVKSQAKPESTDAGFAWLIERGRAPFGPGWLRS